jgi:glycosyltransferase involved in cell wall biosynthesis
LKIGFDAKRILHNFRGLGNYSRSLVEGVSTLDESLDIHLYSPVEKKEEAVSWKKSHSQFRYIYPSSFSSLWRTFGLVKQLRHDSLDIYHGLSQELPIGVDKLDCVKLVTIHDLLYLRNPGHYSLIDRMTYKFKAKYACDKADKVVAICEQTKKDLVEYLKVDPLKIVVLYQSCGPQFSCEWARDDLEKLTLKYNLSENYFLFVSAFEENKNPINLVSAFALFKEKNKSSDFQLVLLGKGSDEYEKQLFKVVGESAYSEDIKVIQNYQYDELPGFYQKAFTTCLPSYFEGFGLPIIESLFSKTPVITTDDTCFRETAGDCAIYVDPYSPSSIAQAMEKLVEDKDFREDLVLRGYDYVQRFNLNETSKKMIQFYQDLLLKKQKD